MSEQESPQEVDFNIEVNAQYLKDLSFESPGAPLSLIQQEMPKIALDVNVNVQKFEEGNFEVTLNVT
ncbi:MAG: protein-export chaperone SecB, partial [Alphaproteobacteria bacterium]|nr:protein-export chaperone SecB [Alphaproteobacteria bacterium]